MITSFWGCEKVIEFNGPITDPIVIVNSFLSPDSIVKAQISQSRFFLSNDTSYTMIVNANVSMFVNGAMKETLTHTANGVYQGTYKPLVGDSIRLLVKVPGKNDLSCSTDIQAQIPVVSIDTSSVLTGTTKPLTIPITLPNGTRRTDTIGTIVGRKLKFSLKFNDDANIKNYYRLVVYTKTYSGTKSSVDYSVSFDDIVSGNTNQNSIGPPTSLTSNKYNVFSDDLINGKLYPLSFSINNDLNVYLPGKSKTIRKEVYVNLQSISRSYYLYLQTRAAIKVNSFFAEPAQVYSNIDGGGIGILGSYTGNLVKINL